MGNDVANGVLKELPMPVHKNRGGVRVELEAQVVPS
jgi:hypothetical protein